MGPITAKIEIDLPRKQIFDQISDLALRPSFTEPYQTDFRLGRIDSRGVGAAARFRVRPGRAWMDTEITEVTSPYRLVETGRCGRYNRVPTKTVWELVELPSGVTEVSVTFMTMPENHFDRLNEVRLRAERRHLRGWNESLKRLREQLESGLATENEVVKVGGVDRFPMAPTGTFA